MSENEEKESFMAKKSLLTLQIAGGAIFGALSIVVAGLTAPFLPRIPGWGMTWYDPISLIWITCFLIFGPIAGILCCIIGSIGLAIFDPTVIGSVFKFLATIPLIIIPTLMLKLHKREKGEFKSKKLKDPKNFIITGVLSIAVRIGLMIIANVIFFMIFVEYFEFANLSIIGLGNITGWTAIIIFTIIVNAYQGALDLLIPYLLVYKTKLDEKYEIW